MFEKPLSKDQEKLVEFYMECASSRERVWHLQYRTPGGRILAKKLISEMPIVWRWTYRFVSIFSMFVTTTISLHIMYWSYLMCGF